MRFAIALTILPFSGTAFAQGFDILRQDVTVDVSSSTITTIDSTAELAAEGSTTELLMLAPPLPNASFAIDGVPATARPHPQYPDLVKIVELPRAFEDGEPFTLDVHSEGALSCGSVLQPGTLACVRNADLAILVPASPDVGWYLLNLLAFDPFVGSVTVRAPSGFEIAAGQGEAIAVEEVGGVAIARFDFARPTENLAVYAGRAERVEADGVLGLYTGDHREKMQRAVDLAAEILPHYGERFGVLPVDRTTIVSIPRGFPFGGIGLIGTVLFGDYVVGELDYLLEQGTAHEVAHTWWGGLAGSSDVSSAGFFNEAFAEWSARWALGRVRGDAERTAGNRMNAVWYMYARPNDGDIAVLDPAVTDSPLYVFVTYHKASVVLRTIEAAMGEAAFTEALRSMIARGPGGTDIGTFVDDLAAAGYDASRDVSEWLESTGFPRISIAVEGNVALAAEVEGEFHLDLPVKAFASDGTWTDSRISLAPGSTSHPIAGAPVLIQLDPEWTSVREVRPALPGDVSFDGAVDGIDLIEVALRVGAHLPTERRVDGSYDPLYDLNGDRRTDDLDLTAITGN